MGAGSGGEDVARYALQRFSLAPAVLDVRWRDHPAPTGSNTTSLVGQATQGRM